MHEFMVASLRCAINTFAAQGRSIAVGAGLSAKVLVCLVHAPVRLQRQHIQLGPPLLCARMLEPGQREGSTHTPHTSHITRTIAELSLDVDYVEPGTAHLPPLVEHREAHVVPQIQLVNRQPQFLQTA